MNHIRSIVAFLSLVVLFFGTVYPVSVHLLFGVPLASTAWDILFAASFTAYFLGCFLSCLSFLRGAALLSVALSIHALVVVIVAIHRGRSYGAPIGMILVPFWLLFVSLYGFMVSQRLREEIN